MFQCVDLEEKNTLVNVGKKTVVLINKPFFPQLHLKTYQHLISNSCKVTVNNCKVKMSNLGLHG